MDCLDTFDVEQFQREILDDGFAIAEGVITSVTINALRTAIDSIPPSEEVRRRTNVYGIRNLLKLSPECRELASSVSIRSLVVPILGEHCFATRGTFFDKVPGANWNLRWHQDSVIAVKNRIDAPGFKAWSTKAGVVQVRPPVDVLRSMLAVRIHLDDCTADNGALRILRGTHRRRWDREDLDEAKSNHEVCTCEIAAGGILAMRPLVLHASSVSESPYHRRVIHLEFANAALPFGLEWNSQIDAGE